MIATKLKTVVARYRGLGPRRAAAAIARSLRVKADMAALEALRLVYGFDRWHARSPDSARSYRRELASLVDGLDPTCVVEVGCGLGGIVARVSAEQRAGYDCDPAVIRAARVLHRGSVRFAVGGFEQVTEEDIDVLIAVNWIHEFSPEQLEAWIMPLLPRLRYLLVDAVDPGSAGGYRFFHDFEFLGKLARSTSLRVEEEPHRRFILWDFAG